MRLQDLDPDAMLREKVFQRIVDMTGIDPQRAAKTLYRSHVVGLLTGIALLWAYLFRPMVTAGLNPFVGLLMAAPVLLNTVMIGLSLKVPPYRSLTPVQATQRICQMAMTTLLLWMMGYAWLRSMPPVFIVCMTVVAASWTAGPSAWYLHLCRQPPPRRPARISTGRLHPTHA